MIKFKIVKEKIELTPQMLMFEEFENIWKYDKSGDKKKAHKMLYFIFLLCDLTSENPNKDVPVESKLEEAKFRAYRDRNHIFSKRDMELLVPAVECYNELNSSAEERILEVFDIQLDRLNQMLEETKPETFIVYRGNKKEYKTNSDTLNKALVQISLIKQTKAAVIAAVKREALDSSVRGKAVLSPLSKGNIDLASMAEYENEVREGLIRLGKIGRDPGTIKVNKEDGF